MREGRNRTIDYCRKNSESCEQTGIGAIPHEWALRPLTEFAQQERNAFSNGPFGSDLLSNELQTQGVPVIYIRDISRYVFNWRSRVYVSDQKATQLSAFSVRFGDVLITKVGSPPCEAAVYNKDIPSVITQDVIRLRPSKGVDSYFLMLMINSLYAQREVRKIKIEGTRERVSLTDFKKIKLPFPPLPEQQKIAAILSTWDEAIEKTQSLIDQLRQRNEGLAQQLLTGKKRLKNLDTPWSQLKFSDFLVESRIKGKNGLHSKKITVKLYGKGVFPKEEKRIGSKNTQYYVRHAGQFIYSKLDFLNGAFGLIPKEMDGFESTLDLPCFDIRTDRVNPSFLLRFACREEFYRKYTGGAIGGRKAKRVQVNEFLNIRCHFPSEEEQQAIAKVLEMAEKELSTHERRLRILRQQKHGLMQKLLTGEIRVTA